MNYLDFVFNNSTLPLYLTGVISFVVFFIKYKFDQRAYYHGILKEKLDMVYSPLMLYFKKLHKEKTIINSEIKEILIHKSHLFSEELLNDMQELLKYEESFIFVEQDDVKLIEYKNIRQATVESLEREFVRLRKLYNKEFYSYKNNIEKLLIERIIIGFIKFSIFLTAATFLFLGVALLGEYFFNESRIIDNLALNTIFVIYTLILILTIFWGGIALLFGLASKILELVNQRKGRYRVFTRIPKNGIYQCNSCGKKRKLFRYADFPICEEHTLWQHIKTAYSFYNWKYITEQVDQEAEGEI
ncbi:MAG: hypothetical protein ACOYVK_14610 [Bacillota bacterium]